MTYIMMIIMIIIIIIIVIMIAIVIMIIHLHAIMVVATVVGPLITKHCHSGSNSNNYDNNNQGCGIGIRGDSDPILPNTALVKKINIRLRYSTLMYYSILFNSTSRCFLLSCSYMYQTCSVIL